MNTELLARFSPAETLLMLEGKSAALKDLLKVTLMDLFLKQVLSTLEASPQSSPSQNSENLLYVTTGKNFQGYAAQEFEETFLSPFYKAPNGQILFRNLVRIGYENAQTPGLFRSKLMKSKNLRDLFQQNLMQKFTGGFSKNHLGEQATEQLHREIKSLEDTLPPLLQNDPEAAQQILFKIKGNVFLLKTLEFSRMKEIDKYVTEDMQMAYAGSSTGSGVGAWLFLSNISDSFDSSSHHHHGDSGCGGDFSSCGGESGCSGGGD